MGFTEGFKRETDGNRYAPRNGGICFLLHCSFLTADMWHGVGTLQILIGWMSMFQGVMTSQPVFVFAKTVCRVDSACVRGSTREHQSSAFPVLVTIQTDIPEILLIRQDVLTAGSRCHSSRCRRLRSDYENRKDRAGIVQLIPASSFSPLLSVLHTQTGAMTFDKLSKLFPANELNYLVLHLR